MFIVSNLKIKKPKTPSKISSPFNNGKIDRNEWKKTVELNTDAVTVQSRERGLSA